MIAKPTPPEKMTVVGAGLVGSLLALFLARRGYSVEVYERRPDMRSEKVSAGRSINLAISERGLHALRQVGLEQEVLAQAVPMRGRMMHAVSGELTFQPYGKDDTQYINSVSRAELNKTLMAAAEATGKVRLNFNQRLIGVDLARGTAQFRDEKIGIIKESLCPRLFGTDGSASVVRSDMVKYLEAEVTQEPLAHGYKELTIARAEAVALKMERNALHIWPRGSHMLIALPNFDGSFTCTLFLPHKGPGSFAELGSEKKVLEFFGREFPDAVPMLPGLVEEFFRNPTGQMVTVRSAPWNAKGRALLLGDAAHAIVPFFGQGMNCGFEDCTRLDELLGQHQDWEKIFSEFSLDRKPHADAIASMAIENFVEMRDKVGDPRFLLEKQVERELQKTFPDTFVSRYAWVTFSRAPYRFSYEVGEIQAGILRELCQGIERVEQLDLEKAGELIRLRLIPFLDVNRQSVVS